MRGSLNAYRSLLAEIIQCSIRISHKSLAEDQQVPGLIVPVSIGTILQGGGYLLAVCINCGRNYRSELCGTETVKVQGIVSKAFCAVDMATSTSASVRYALNSCAFAP